MENAARNNHLRCSQCKLLFKSNAKLLAHVQSSHTADVRRFHCHHCLSGFLHKTSLDRHIKIVHPQFADHTSNNKRFIVSQKATTKPIDNNNADDDTDDDDPNEYYVDVSLEPNNNNPEAIDANLQSKPNSNEQLEHTSESELTTVAEMLSTTNPGQFHGLFTSSLTSSNVAVSSAVAISASISRPISRGSSVAERVSARNTPDKFPESLADTDISMEQGSEKLDANADVLNDSGESSLKRKRNSYADSPHKLRCPYCPRAFPWISSLKRHILTHTGQKPFRCPQCPVTFSTKSNRERHMIRKHGLDIHDPVTRQMMERPYKCHLCGVFCSFSSAGKLVKHYRSKHSDCDIPEDLMSSIPNMTQEELNWALSKAVSDQDGCSGQNHSGERTDSDDTLTQDMDNDDSDSEDEDGDTSTGDENGEKNTAEAAVEAVVRAVAQVPSGTSTTDIPSLLDVAAVLRVPLPESRNGSENASCSSCVNPERDNYNVDRITECWQCLRIFDCRKSLLRHLKEHGVDLPFKCYLCDASFASRLASLDHKSTTHASDWTLLREKNHIGNDLTDFAEYVDRVVEDALGGGIPPATARRIRDGVDLDVRMETDYAQRKVFCSLCPKRFWSLQDLRRHMRSHTGERPFECDVCHARFTLKHSMMRHRRKHEGSGADLGDIQSDSEDDGLPAEFLVNGEQGVFIKSEIVDVPVAVLPDLIQSMPVCETTPDSKPQAVQVVYRHATSDSQLSTMVSLAEVKSDLLENLLGVSDSQTLDQMLDSADSAAVLLGVNKPPDSLAPADVTSRA
jgi:uncharacterized Zn-finger protein